MATISTRAKSISGEVFRRAQIQKRLSIGLVMASSEASRSLRLEAFVSLTRSYPFQVQTVTQDISRLQRLAQTPQH